MWIQKCIDMAATFVSSGNIFTGFAPERSYSFRDYALQSGFPAARTYIESKIHYGEKIGHSAEHEFMSLIKEYETAIRIWDRLANEQGWENDDFKIFDDAFLDYHPLGNDSYLAYCLGNGWEEYTLIEHANRCWNLSNPDKEQKPTSFPEEALKTALKRFDEATERERNKLLKDLDHHTRGISVEGMSEEGLKATFGDRAVCIIYVQNRMTRDAEVSARMRADVEQQYACRPQ